MTPPIPVEADGVERATVPMPDDVTIEIETGEIERATVALPVQVKLQVEVP